VYTNIIEKHGISNTKFFLASESLKEWQTMVENQ